MPVLIAAAASSALFTSVGVAAATPIIGTLTAGGLLTSILSTGLSMGLSAILRPAQKKSVRQEQVTIRDSNPRRLAGYGRMKMGGASFSLDANGWYVVIGQVHCEGPIDAYEEWWVNDTKAALAAETLGGLVGVAPWIATVGVESHLGAADQAASGLLLGYAPGWTPAHQLKGLAYTVQTAVLPPKPEKYFQLTFPNGNPTIRVVARLRRVLDTRSGLVVWSQNPALCIRDFLIRERVDQVTGKTWRYLSSTRIDEASFSAFANLCDEPVPLAAAGKTEPRYRLNGLYGLDEEPREVLQRMLATCDAEIVALPSGKVGIRGGQWEEPVVTLTEDMLLDFEYRRGDDKLAAFNSLKWTFTDPFNDYQTVEGDPWDDVDDQDEREEVLTESIELLMVHSHSQGRRLCKARMARANPRHRLVGCKVKLPALALFGERVVRVVLPSIGLDAVFAIERLEPSGDFMSVSLDLASLRSDMYTWNAQAEEGTPPARLAPPGQVGPQSPQDVRLELVRIALAPTVYQVQIRASANPETGATLLGRYRGEGVGDDGWMDLGADSANSVLSPVLEDGRRYEVQLAWVAGLMQSEWSTTQSILVTADISPPSAPLGLVANGGAGKVTLAWTAPGSVNVYSTRLYRARGAVAPIDDATMIREVNLASHQSYDMIDDDVSAGVYRYWVRAANGSGIEGDPAGPVNATVT